MNDAAAAQTEPAAGPLTLHPLRTTTLWGRSIAVTTPGGSGVSRPSVRAFLARLTAAGEEWTATEVSHFDGMVDGSVRTNVSLTRGAVQALLKDRDIGAYISRQSTHAARIILHSFVESVDVRSKRADEEFVAEMRRRRDLARMLDQFVTPHVQWGPVYAGGVSTALRNAAEERERFIVGDCNEGDPIAADERAESARAWGTADPREVIARIYAVGAR